VHVEPSEKPLRFTGRLVQLLPTDLTSVDSIEGKKNTSGLFWEKRNRLRSPTAADPLNYIRVFQHIPVTTGCTPHWLAGWSSRTRGAE
tara:strand:- start:460 stop:723 length:264 start_codon:yes stop_codon:yes gene_type:complete